MINVYKWWYSIWTFNIFSLKEWFLKKKELEKYRYVNKTAVNITNVYLCLLTCVDFLRENTVLLLKIRQAVPSLSIQSYRLALLSIHIQNYGLFLISFLNKTCHFSWYFILVHVINIKEMCRNSLQTCMS